MNSDLYSSYSPSRAVEDVVVDLAKNGRIRYDWQYIRRLLRFKMYNVSSLYSVNVLTQCFSVT